MRDIQNLRRVKIFWLAGVSLIFILFGANCARNNSSPVAEKLSQGKPVTNKIVSDEIDSYTVELEKGQFLSLSIEQHDVDVITKVFAPDGELIGEFDTPISRRGNCGRLPH